MKYPKPYEPSEEEISAICALIRRERLDKLQKTKPSKCKKGCYQRGVTNVPCDVRPIVGTNYQ